MNISSLHFSYATNLRSVCRTIASHVRAHHIRNRYTKKRDIIKPYRQSLDHAVDVQLVPEEITTPELVHWPMTKVITLKPSEHSQPLQFQTDVD